MTDSCCFLGLAIRISPAISAHLYTLKKKKKKSTFDKEIWDLLVGNERNLVGGIVQKH